MQFNIERLEHCLLRFHIAVFKKSHATEMLETLSVDYQNNFKGLCSALELGFEEMCSKD